MPEDDKKHLKEGKGAAFWNGRKSQSNHPDFIGNGLIDGKEYSIGAWMSKTEAKGELYIYVSFTKKDEVRNDPMVLPY